MTQYLPPNLLALFAPREQIPYFPPLDRLPWEKKEWPYHGVGNYVHLFEDPSETPAPTRAETKEERAVRKLAEREERNKGRLKNVLETWDPSSDSKIQGDPFKTIFVGRINYDTSESKLRRELEVYGPIKRINIVHNQEKPRGYAFVEYEKERDMHSAYKYGDGKKIDGRRIVVDVERGRTVKSWKPRRLGGGLGGTRIGEPQQNIKYSGRVDERSMGGKSEGGKSEDRDKGDRGDRRGPNQGDFNQRRRSRSRERGREKEREKERERDRDKRKRSRSRERDRGKDRKDRSKSRERDRKKGRDKDRGEREKDRKSGSRKDKDKDRDRDKERSHRDHDRKRARDEEGGKERSNDVGDNGQEEERGEGGGEKRARLESESNAHVGEQGTVKSNGKED